MRKEPIEVTKEDYELVIRVLNEKVRQLESVIESQKDLIAANEKQIQSLDSTIDLLRKQAEEPRDASAETRVRYVGIEKG